ncbi:serine/threonine protein phosphatase [Leptolyngbya sp. NK1-12]|uniref:Serine/threonine protein phosphatase n=1 Tax=Leptolyngbya sp. NK1-12 TaxID=2547451 RepID=A0AA97AGJ7_9CYAN|nr:serine/threonine protein phosphatase [Leptolyngbya sp. NK1-12]
MQNAAAMLYCPNPTCQAANSEDQKFCQKCSTPLPHRYLWALGESASAYRAGDLVAERYLCKQPSVFLDTKPGLLSGTYQELPEFLLPYLRLTSYPLHIPQIYDWLPIGTTVGMALLDHVPLCPTDTWMERQLPGLPSASDLIQLLPTLTAQWPQASPLRQLNWLWQIANLWQPLSSENAATTLFTPDLLRVESGLLRLLELKFQTNQPTLADLGQLWLQWAKTAQPEVADFLVKLCQGLIQGQIHNAELLMGYLDQGLAQLSQAQTRQIQIATLSDQGPTRQRNEDACYPASGTKTPILADQALLIVCDGIGGHQGGDVASHLAITTLEQRVKGLDISQLDSTSLAIELEKAICAANDQISQRNDSEHRFDRQRMGTTVVMALVRGHELYITHVGDSRAYWITHWGCHQLTLDDDVASREVRLGYSFYRQALHQPSGGSLVQALGMGTSSTLYPTVQRFIPDEDGIFLLCSDGLSDNDRVEAFWESEILPLLSRKGDLLRVAQRLVEIGNTHNGYDNVTVGLVHYQTAITHPIPTLAELGPLQLPITTQPTESGIRESQLTELVSPVASSTSYPTASTATEQTAEKSNLLPLLIGIGLLLGLGGLLAVLLPTLQSDPGTTPFGDLPAPTPSPTLSSPSPSDPVPTSLEVGSKLQLVRSPEASSSASGSANPPVLVSRPPQDRANSLAAPALSTPSPTVQTIGLIPIGTVLEVLRKQSLSQQENWVELRVCSTSVGDSPEAPASPPSSPSPPAPSPIASPEATSSTPTPTTPLLQPGQTGWIQEAEILPLVTLKTDLTPEQQQACSRGQ